MAVSGQRMIQNHSRTDHILQRIQIKSDIVFDEASALLNHQEREVVSYVSNVVGKDSTLTVFTKMKGPCSITSIVVNQNYLLKGL